MVTATIDFSFRGADTTTTTTVERGDFLLMRFEFDDGTRSTYLLQFGGYN